MSRPTGVGVGAIVAERAAAPGAVCERSYDRAGSLIGAIGVIRLPLIASGYFT